MDWPKGYHTHLNGPCQHAGTERLSKSLSGSYSCNRRRLLCRCRLYKLPRCSSSAGRLCGPRRGGEIRYCGIWIPRSQTELYVRELALVYVSHDSLCKYHFSYYRFCLSHELYFVSPSDNPGYGVLSIRDSGSYISFHVGHRFKSPHPVPRIKTGADFGGTDNVQYKT